MESQTQMLPSGRLISLDAFRGITIAAMILVNFPGNGEAVYAPLEHAAWNGITPTDLIFPFFLFIVGVSVAFSYTKQINEKKPLGRIYGKLVFRAFKIFMLGLLLNFLFTMSFRELRYAGVLPRIAIVFLLCAILFLNTSWKTQLITGVLILVGYWLAMTLIPTPTFGKVMLEPGKNLAAWVDSKYLPGKMWQGTWDPEGILSTLPAVVTGIAGMLTGTFLLTKRNQDQKTMYLFTAGFLLTILGTIWSWRFPLNKNLWTSSFVLFTAGMALMTLSSLIFIVDILGYKKWTKFAVIFGSNAIAIYVLADFLYILFYMVNIGGNSLNMHFFNLFSTSMGLAPKFVSMLYSLVFVAINFVPAYLLYRKKVFIRL